MGLISPPAAVGKPVERPIGRGATGDDGIERPPDSGGLVKGRTGGDLLSREVALRVPSALRGLTALFGMGRGVSPSLYATGNLRDLPRWSLKTAQGAG
jgi:hypothetical protein